MLFIVPVEAFYLGAEKQHTVGLSDSSGHSKGQVMCRVPPRWGERHI